MKRRRIYKPDRKPARADGIKIDGQITEASLTMDEVRMALWCVGKNAGILIGRILGYDRMRDEFTVRACSLIDQTEFDAKIRGEVVGHVVRLARLENGGRPLRLVPAA